MSQTSSVGQLMAEEVFPAPGNIPEVIMEAGTAHQVSHAPSRLGRSTASRS